MTQPPFSGNDFFDQIDSVARNLTGNAFRLKKNDPTAPQKFTEFVAQSEQEFGQQPQPQAAQPQSFTDFEQGGFQQPQPSVNPAGDRRSAILGNQQAQADASAAETPSKGLLDTFVQNTPLGQAILGAGRYFRDESPLTRESGFTGGQGIPGGISQAISGLGPNFAANAPGQEPFIPESFVKGEGFERGLREGIRGFSHPQELLLTAETAGIGPGLAAGIRAGGSSTLRKIAANLLEPVGGGFGRRVGFEGGAGLGANIGGSVVQETLPEDVTGIPRVAATIGGALLGGGAGAVGGLKAVDAGARISPIGTADVIPAVRRELDRLGNPSRVSLEELADSRPLPPRVKKNIESVQEGMIEYNRGEFIPIDDPRVKPADTSWNEFFSRPEAAGVEISYDTRSGGRRRGTIGSDGTIIPDANRRPGSIGKSNDEIFLDAENLQPAADRAAGIEIVDHTSRGKRPLVERLQLEVRKHDIDPDIAEVADIMIRSLPDETLEELGSSFFRVGAFDFGDVTAAGFYDTDSSMMNIAKGALQTNLDPEKIIPHEIAHHLKRFITDDEYDKLIKLYKDGLKDGGQKQLDKSDDLMAKATKSKENPNPIKLTDEDRRLMRDAYRWKNSDEFFAEIMSDRVLRDIYERTLPNPERDIFAKLLDKSKDLTIALYNVLIRRGRTDDAERMYQRIFVGDFDPEIRQTFTEGILYRKGDDVADAAARGIPEDAAAAARGAGDAPTKSVFDTPVGEKVTVYDSAGNPREATVAYKSDTFKRHMSVNLEGSDKYDWITLDDAVTNPNGTLVDGRAFYAEDPTTPAYKALLDEKVEHARITKDVRAEGIKTEADREFWDSWLDRSNAADEAGSAADVSPIARQADDATTTPATGTTAARQVTPEAIEQQMKLQVTRNNQGRNERRYTGIVMDYVITGDTRNGYTVYGSANTAERVQKNTRIILTKTLKEAKAKIAKNESNYHRNLGSEIRPRLSSESQTTRKTSAAAKLTPEQQAIIDDVGTGALPADDVAVDAIDAAPVSDGKAGGSGPPEISGRPTADADFPESSRTALFRPAPTLAAKDDPLIKRAAAAIKATKPATQADLQALAKGRKVQIARAGGSARKAASFSDVGGQFQKGLGGEIARPEFESIAPLFQPEEIESLLSRIWGRGSVLEFKNAKPGQVNFRQFNADIAFKKLFHPDSATLPTPFELELLERVYGSELIRAVLSKKKFGQKAWDIAMDLWNLPRSLLATGDISATARQAAVLGPGNPKQFKDAFKSQIKAFMNEDYTLASREAMEADEDFLRYTTKSGRPAGIGTRADQRLHIGAIGQAADLSRREEAFMTRIAGRLPLVRNSERAFVTMLNELRFSVMKRMVKATETASGGPATDEQLDAIAAFINYATGRGSLGKAEGAAPLLNGLGFSPRLALSRFQLPLPILTRAPNVRKKFAQDLTIAGGSLFTLLWLADKSPDIDVESTPLSSDFGKMRIGKTRLDFGAGNLQAMRFLSQVVSGKKESIATQSQSEAKRTETVGRFLRTKAHPSLGLVLDVSNKEDFLGDDFTLAPEEFLLFHNTPDGIKFDLDFRRNPGLKTFTPMFIQDIVEAWKESGPLLAGVASIAAPIGIGVSSFGTVEDASQELWGLSITEVQPFQQELAKELKSRTSESGPGAFDQADIRQFDTFQDIVEQFKAKTIDKRTAVSRYFSTNTFYSGLREGLSAGIFGGDLNEESVFPKAPSGGTDAEKAALQGYYDSSAPFESLSGFNSEEWEKVLKVLERKWNNEGTLEYVLANTHMRPIPEELIALLPDKTVSKIRRSSDARERFLRTQDAVQLEIDRTPTQSLRGRGGQALPQAPAGAKPLGSTESLFGF